MRKLFVKFFGVAVLVLTSVSPGVVQSLPLPPAKIAPAIWLATQADKTSDVVIAFVGYPDLSTASRLNTKIERTRFVFAVLSAQAERSQHAFWQRLQQDGKTFTVLWLTNSIWVRQATRADVLRWAARSEVRSIEPNRSSRLSPPLPVTNAPRVRTKADSIEWGVQRVNAPALWALGYRGQGIVLASSDTGVLWDHAALKTHYRGWDGVNASHDYNWFDPIAQVPVPLDDYGHGTHTVGTMVGNDGGANQIGVAPDAQWIGCRNMNSGVGSVASYIACFQFLLAPTTVAGLNPDPDKSADISSNSWGCDVPSGELGCDEPTALVTATQSLRMAGIMVVASAGNEGQHGCSTVQSAPGALSQSFTVGASDIQDNMAGFSSRGPSRLTGQLKPDLVAPGSNVRSAGIFSATTYVNNSGTSMAAPHVAGVVALLWSAAPGLRGRVDETEAILRRTARPLATTETCGGLAASAIPNNTSGYGLIDAHAAYSEALRGRLAIAAPLTLTVGASMPLAVTWANDMAISRTNVSLTVTLPASFVVEPISGGASVTGTQVVLTAGAVLSNTSVSVSVRMTATVQGSWPITVGVESGDGAIPLTQSVPLAVDLSSRVLLPLVMR